MSKTRSYKLKSEQHNSTELSGYFYNIIDSNDPTMPKHRLNASALFLFRFCSLLPYLEKSSDWKTQRPSGVGFAHLRASSPHVSATSVFHTSGPRTVSCCASAGRLLVGPWLPCLLQKYFKTYKKICTRFQQDIF